MLFKVIFWFSCVAICAHSNENSGGPKLRVIGGQDAQIIYPFMASLQVYARTTSLFGLISGDAKYQHICGGSIVGKDCIVTAAHCVENSSTNPLSVLVGTNNLDDNLGQRYYLQNYTVHHKYSTLVESDIAVIRLNESMKFSDFVGPIALSKEFIYEKIILQLIGWGYTNPFKIGQTPSKLQVLNTTSISNEECNKRFSVQASETDLCTYQRLGQGACNGDSGGPLIWYPNGKAVLGGLVSRGFMVCSMYSIPDVFTRASSFFDWIHEQCGIEKLVTEEN